MRNISYFLIFFSFLVFTSSGFPQENKSREQQSLKVGMKAPDFKLKDAYGHSYKLSSFKGKMPVIVYFYPKAGTSGCTKEACGIRDTWSDFKKSKVQVLGISVDEKQDIKKFIDDYHLNFPLLSDADRKVSKEYGVYNDNGFDNRITFIVDKKGEIADIINVKDIDKHASEVLEIASKLN